MKLNHNLTLDYLREATVADLVALEVSALAALDEQVAALNETLKTYRSKLDATYQRRFGASAHSLLAEEGRDTGTAHVRGDGWDVTVTIPKKVEWDQGKLKAALDSLPPSMAQLYADVKVSVQERLFAAAPPDIQKVFEPARTVKPGKPSYTFKQAEAEAA